MKWLAAPALLLILSAQALAEGGFLSGISDLPLMQGLSEDAQAALVFETPEGRIAQFAAKGQVSQDDIRRFYGETLPELGWTPKGQGRFWREKEELRLIVKSLPAGGSEARFELTPIKSK
ncbi:exported hypothetical protein [Rhodospirillaceae bacterium LM-1]|nr:exported hypothetical protein [Rhodospirillaceae bacterium LM-1]